MNYKFLPFVIGMTLASTAANAADGSFSNLTVSNSANIASCKLSNLEVTNPATFRNQLSAYSLNVGKPTTENTLLEINMAPSYMSDNFIQANNRNVGAYTIMFQVDKNGLVSSRGWNVSGGSAVNTSMCPHISCKSDPNDNRAFLFSTSGYQYKPEIHFSADGYKFDGGNMTVNGKITCKDELEVIGLTASTIKADDINVNMNNAADYVFDENYDLKSLSEVESYVNEHKHLPGIPSAAEMEQNGISVSAMSNMLLEKVEELTLHMIQLKKENEALKAEVKSLKK
ncbi:MAG: hypothetical protein IKV67_07620 [Paludibacteraceae bacterium]|nr:hypothetical protein [Paludibacteraceae bacterium]